MEEPVGGVVVCGGRSRRMARSKACLPLGGEPMLLRVVRRLAAIASPIVVVSAKGRPLPPLPSEVTLAFDRLEDAGPLEGIRVGLETLAGQVDRAFVTSCDAPLLQPAFVRAVVDRLGEADMAVPCDGQHVHCLAGAYRVTLAEPIERLLQAGERRPRALLEQVAAVKIPVDELRPVDPRLESLRNINTPEEYQVLVDEVDFDD